MRRIERLINLIAALLEATKPLTAEDIHEQIAGYDHESFATFRRAFERDKEALRAMGIPLEIVPSDPLSDHPDGYVISKNRYYLPQLDLEPDELAALRIAAEAVLGGRERADLGLMKVAIDAPVEPWGSPRLVWGTDVAAEQPALEPIYSALLERTPVGFGYKAAGSNEVVERTIEPYGLVHRGGHWYVVGRDLDRDAVRSFKLSRIADQVHRGSTSKGDTYRVPDGFDATAHLGGEAWAIGDESLAATLRFDSSIRWWAEQNMPGFARREAPDGALDVDVPVANLDALTSWVIGFGGGVRILSPPEAIERLVGHLRPVEDMK